LHLKVQAAQPQVAFPIAKTLLDFACVADTAGLLLRWGALFLIVPPDSESWLPTEEVSPAVSATHAKSSSVFAIGKATWGCAACTFRCKKSARLLRVLMGFTLAYLIVLLLGTDPFAEKLRPYFEQQRRKPRTEPARFSAYCPSLCKCSPIRVGKATGAKTLDRDSRATGAGAWSGAAAGLLALTSRARSLSRNPRSSSPVSVGEIVCVLPSSECRVRSRREKPLHVCLVSENVSTLRQFLCGREFIALEINFAGAATAASKTGGRMNAPRAHPNTGEGKNCAALTARAAERLGRPGRAFWFFFSSGNHA